MDLELDPNAKEFVPDSSRSSGGGSDLAPPVSLTDPKKKTAAARIQADWSQSSHWPSEFEIKRAARLAWEGPLTSVEYLRIVDKRITDILIPRDQMEKLASIVTRRVWIDKMTHTDQLRSILTSVKCPLLWLRRMILSDTETRALVTAMRDRVELQRVALYNDVTPDVEELIQYDGQGSCRELWLYYDMITSYEERLRGWVADKEWTLTVDDGVCLVMKK